MITKEELERTFSNMNNHELLEIIDRKFEHTELAVLVALQELSKRNLSEDDIFAYKAEKVEKVNKFFRQNIIDDLNLIQKNLFYFIWLPFFTFPIKRNFIEDGCVLKLKQANYYSFLGLAAFIIVCILNASYDLSLSISFALMVALFIPTYFFDEFFNRQKQIERLQKRFREQQEATIITPEEDTE